MVLKIVISLKNSFPTVCCWKKKELLLPVDTDQRDLVTLSGHPLKIESDSTAADLQLNLLFSNAVYFTMNLQLWHIKRASHPVNAFDVIVRRDISIHLGEM